MQIRSAAPRPAGHGRGAATTRPYRCRGQDRGQSGIGRCQSGVTTRPGNAVRPFHERPKSARIKSATAHAGRQTVDADVRPESDRRPRSRQRPPGLRRKRWPVRRRQPARARHTRLVEHREPGAATGRGASGRRAASMCGHRRSPKRFGWPWLAPEPEATMIHEGTAGAELVANAADADPVRAMPAFAADRMGECRGGGFRHKNAWGGHLMRPAVGHRRYDHWPVLEQRRDDADRADRPSPCRSRATSFPPSLRR